MTYPWREKAEAEGGGSEKLPEGFHRIRIVKVVRGTQTKSFESRSGDPQIMLVAEDSEERQATRMFTLSRKAAWTLSRAMSRLGVDLEDLEKRKIEPFHFESQQYAEEILVGREGWVEVTHDQGYANFEAYHQSEVPPEVLQKSKAEGGRAPSVSDPGGRSTGQRHEPIDPDDIPF